MAAGFLFCVGLLGIVVAVVRALFRGPVAKRKNRHRGYERNGNSRYNPFDDR